MRGNESLKEELKEEAMNLPSTAITKTGSGETLSRKTLLLKRGYHLIKKSTLKGNPITSTEKYEGIGRRK